MITTKPDEIKRTLIVTCGPLSQTVGAMFSARLVERQGPQAAMAVLSTGDDDLDTAVTSALTRISPPDLAALLATHNWRLASPAELSLFLLVDAASGAGENAAMLAEQLTAVIYRHLGVEAASLLIWLMGAAGESAAAECLSVPVGVSRGTAVLGLCNEAGYRLPDDDALCRAAAELLWCLAVTTLQTLPEQATLQNELVFSGDQPLFTIGLSGWEWSPAATHAAFTCRWLDNVLAHWLARSEEDISSAEVAAWMESCHLGLADVATHLLKEEEQQLPRFPGEAWRMPWPWDLSRLLTETLFTAEVDDESLIVFQEHACLRLAGPLHRATAVLQQQAQAILNDNPIAGIARACAWLEAVMVEYDRLIEQTLDEQETLNESMSALATERGPVETHLKAGLAAWPPARWQNWTAATLRPWRWPGLVWRYGQMQQAGWQLCHILRQQAALKRQCLLNKTSRQAMSELRQITRRVSGQVEEVGEMLQYLAGEWAGHGEQKGKAQAVRAATSCQWPGIALPVPHALYPQLIPDDAAEAVAAAAALGGLGQQVTGLDDAIGAGLHRFGEQRLAGVWHLTAADALMAWAGDHEQLQVRWQEAWDAACPLWRVDEARLAESVREQNGWGTAVCGADAHLLADLLPETDGNMTWLPSGDRKRLWLARVRTGI
ncbi:MAG: hypothetical protein KF770_15720 [Anaerolineae bacterium]|nr:hypothetical protein [Anaerolineae bacterium]